MHWFRNWFSSLFLMTFVIGLSACGSGGGSSSGGGSQSTPAATATALSASGATVTAGSSVTLTATVTSSGAAISAGSVTFYDGANSLGAKALNSAGQAQWTAATLAAGTHSLAATYAGTSSFAASTSPRVSVSVTALTTTLTLTSSTGAAVQGLPVEFVAQVAGVGSTVPTGTVTFTNGSTTLGTSTLDPTGTANFTSTLLPIGTNSVTASYGGDAVFSASTALAAVVDVTGSAAQTYSNPLTLILNGSLHGVSCADPAIYKDQTSGVNTWYLYCTSDALYSGDPNTHYISIYSSSDLVNWTYHGDAFSGLPTWAKGSGAGLWAPAIKYFNGQYYLYYAASASNLAGSGSAIGVGTSSSPAGPFVDAGAPAVAPQVATNCCNGAYRSTIDPDEIQDTSGQRYILFGSFTGGIYVRKLSADGLTSDATSEQQIAVDNRYEGGNWWYHDGYYYLFASSTNCCNGPLSGYSVYVGRATTPMGPYTDAAGIGMTAVNPGGTPVLEMNGNSVIGPGGNVVFTDEAGQDYILYHGILAASLYYIGAVGYTARPGFIDAVDWENGWPVTRGGFGPSDADAPQPMPIAQPGGTSGYVSVLATEDTSRTQLTAFSDEFNGATLGSQWSSLHQTPVYQMTGSAYQVSSVAYDPIGSMQNVPMIAETAPSGDYIIETKLDINLPVSGVGPDYAQAGVLLLKDDSNFVRVDLYNNNDTRQIEFIKAETAQQSGYPTWGATNIGAALIGTDVSAWLRIVKRNVDGQEHYTAYSSIDGLTWTRGGTWVHTLGSQAKICLYAGNRSGYTASFDYVRVSTLQ
ncbi:MAG TPA: family 43 glycosylhydrolase [Terracidiphilus sp.]|nr:family 43 glycosylhydrolase [Terracidiphilus sp.]